MGHLCRWFVHIICKRNRSYSEIPRRGQVEICNSSTILKNQNEVEYEALLKGMELAKSLGAESVVV